MNVYFPPKKRSTSKWLLLWLPLIITTQCLISGALANYYENLMGVSFVIATVVTLVVWATASKSEERRFEAEMHAFKKFRQDYFDELKKIIDRLLDDGQPVVNCELKRVFKQGSDESIVWAGPIAVQMSDTKITGVAHSGVSYDKDLIGNVKFSAGQTNLDIQSSDYYKAGGGGVLVVSRERLMFFSQTAHGGNWTVEWKEISAWETFIDRVVVRFMNGRPRMLVFGLSGQNPYFDTNLIDLAMDAATGQSIDNRYPFETN